MDTIYLPDLPMSWKPATMHVEDVRFIVRGHPAGSEVVEQFLATLDALACSLDPHISVLEGRKIVKESGGGPSVWQIRKYGYFVDGNEVAQMSLRITGYVVEEALVSAVGMKSQRIQSWEAAGPVFVSIAQKVS